MSKKDIALFVEQVEGSHICGYSDNEQNMKDYFHSEGKKILRLIAKRLGFARGSYDIRSNMGGIAVCGEVTLHADNIYVQLSQSCLGNNIGILYRHCSSRKDYTGGRNRWMIWNQLMDLDKAITCFKEAIVGK